MVFIIPSSTLIRAISIRLLATGSAMPPTVTSATAAHERTTSAEDSIKAATEKAPQPEKLFEPGLSWPQPSSTPVGPGASKDGAYKNPEYYLYNEMSYFDIEAEMMKMRLPQPSNSK